MEISNYNIAIGNATDVGRVREHNEDYMAHFDTPLGYCIIVCDGMGGHTAGDVASQNAVDAIKHFLQNGKITKLDISISLQNAIEFANYKLHEMVQKNTALKGMGTTCVIALIHNAEMFVAHAGDSRLYLIRGKEIRQITKDHSTVQNLIDAGALTEKEAELSDKKNQITKAIGIFERVEPTITNEAIQLLHNDKILLCCDGLMAHVSKEKIAETIFSEKDIQTAALKLVSQANDGGGSDNITVQIIHYTGKSSVLKAKQKLPLKKYLLIAALLAIVIVVSFFCYKNITSPEKEKVPINDTTKNSTNNKEPKDSSDKKLSKSITNIIAPEKDNSVKGTGKSKNNNHNIIRQAKKDSSIKPDTSKK